MQKEVSSLAMDLAVYMKPSSCSSTSSILSYYLRAYMLVTLTVSE